MPLEPLLLEHLPNEIFGEILSYLNGVHAFISISPLNRRLRSLVRQYCTAVDFKLIDKPVFDRFFEQSNIQQWNSLRLVNDEDTPGQIEYFIRKYASHRCFGQLRSLSLLSTTPLRLSSLSERSTILENLVSLTIASVQYVGLDQLKLPALKRLIITSSGLDITRPQNFPQLESLECQLSNPHWTWPATLKRLKLITCGHVDGSNMVNSLRQLSRLETLELYQRKVTSDTWPDGRIWEELITSSLALLKSFRFYFQMKQTHTPNNQIQNMIASFSTPFYVIEKNWFIQCDIRKHKNHNSSVVLYSLPLGFDQLNIIAKYFNESITTLPNDSNQNRFPNIYASATSLTFNRAAAYNEDFNRARIIHLTLNCYIDFTQWIRALTSLCSLEIASEVRIWSKNFARLLDNAPNLRSLTIEKNLLRGVTQNWANPHICHLLSTQIRSLKLCFRRSVLSNGEIPLIASIFARNCQHLSISFSIRPKTIGYILRHMVHLQSLNVIIESETPVDSKTLYADFKQRQLPFTSSNSVITTVSRKEWQLRKYSRFESYLMSLQKGETMNARHYADTYIF